MHRLLMALGTVQVLGLAFAVPMNVMAQEATPTAATGMTAMTDVRYVVPFTADGLNPALTATATVEGSCLYESSAVLGRPDAWECVGADDQLYDPCFENPFAPLDEPGQVACLASPFSSEVVLLSL